MNFGETGKREVRKFLIVLHSIFTCLEDKIYCKIGSFNTNRWNKTKFEFKQSHIGLKSGFASPSLSKWGWGPKFSPIDNPCTSQPPCSSCEEDHKRNKRIVDHNHWMNFHHIKEECPNSTTWPGCSHDHNNVQIQKKPEYVDGKMIYYCNIGCCPEECGCCDCEMNATKEDNTQCKEHVPDHPANFDKEKHIEYPRRMFIENEVQNEFHPVQLPNVEKTCDTCQDNVFDHRFFHRSYHLFCNSCNYIKNVSERTFANIA